MRKPRYEDLEERVLKWFSHVRANNVPVSGAILMEKANAFAEETGFNFKCSSGWLEGLEVDITFLHSNCAVNWIKLMNYMYVQMSGFVSLTPSKINLPRKTFLMLMKVSFFQAVTGTYFEFQKPKMPCRYS